MIIACGNGGANTLAYSTDGTSWTGLGNSVFSGTGIGATHNGSMWVAGGSPSGPGNSIAYSSDGTTWTGLGNSVFTISCNFTKWNGSMWVAGAGGANSLGYSTNGTTWTGRCNTSVYGIASNTYKILPLTLTL